jgi:sugar phosphate isomerase/epimerase
MNMRKVTLYVGQWADLTLAEICQVAQKIGYDGLELSFKPSLIDLARAARDPSYAQEIRGLLADCQLDSWAVSAHSIGQCVGDLYDQRLDRYVPERLRGKPEAIRDWAVDQMLQAPHAARNLGCRIVTGFLGSPIWKFFFSFPPTSEDMVSEGFAAIARLWKPILDEFKACEVVFAHEVHPAEIAFDYYTTLRLLDSLEQHPAFGLNFDPSHLLWQGVDPALFIRDFPARIRHVHMKDVAVHRDGRASSLGSHLPFGDARRGWNFRSVGRGDVRFEEIIRALNDIGYSGPLSVEWEDNGMDRLHGAAESLAYTRRLQFPPSGRSFEDLPVFR